MNERIVRVCGCVVDQGGTNCRIWHHDYDGECPNCHQPVRAYNLDRLLRIEAAITGGLKWVRGEGEWTINLGDYRLATVFDNGVWFTWDVDGTGMENSTTYSVEQAKFEAGGSVISQGLIADYIASLAEPGERKD